MIDLEEGVEVRVQLRATKQTLGESKPSSQSPLYVQDLTHKMIEAKTDQRFQIEVVITRNFDFKGARYVRVLAEMDGGIRTLSKHITQRSIKSKSARSTCHLNTLRTLDDGKWRNFGFAFGQLKTDNAIDLTAEEAIKEALIRGNITVTVQRGSVIHSDYNAEDETDLAPVRSLKTSDAVIREHCKTHGLKCINGGTQTKPPAEQWAFAPAGGGRGKPIVYTFTYVSRDVLLANKKTKPPKEITASKDERSEKTSETKSSSAENEKSVAKKTVEFVDMSNDDDEDRPVKIMKVEVPNDGSNFRIPGFQKQNVGTETPKPAPGNKPTTSILQKDNTKVGHGHDNKLDSAVEAPENISEDKTKRRLKMMEELEDLKLQQKINKMEQAIRKLDEE